MSQPRSHSPFHHLGRRFSIRSYYSVQHAPVSHRSNSKRLAKDKKMSGALPVDPMEIDSGSSEKYRLESAHNSGTFLEEEKADEQFEIINRDNLGDISFYSQPNKPLGATGELETTLKNSLEAQDEKRMQQNAEKPSSLDDKERNAIKELKSEDVESHDLQLQLQQLRNEYELQMNVLRSKVTNLEFSTLRQPPTAENRDLAEGMVLSNVELRNLYEERIMTLEKNLQESERQIHELLNVQEPALKYQAELEKRYKLAISIIEKEKHTREDNESNIRSEIATIRGAYQKEKERAQKLMRTMAEMQSADPFKLDNTSIISSVRELRYDIKNWVRAQRLVPSLPAQGLISTYANKALGGKEKGPNYEFLKDLTPNFSEYTESPQDFKWLLQAYVWKRIVELIFYEDLWIGVRKSLNDEETEYKLLMGYRHMKMKLTPEDETNQEYIAQFHEWRSNSARILDKRVSSERRKRTIEAIRDDILRPLYKATDSGEQEIQNVEDLEAVIESAMRLGANMAQQKAYFTFEFLPVAMFGRMEFSPKQMTDPFAPDSYDSRTHSRTVWLNLAPRLMKHGTSEGTNFDTSAQLLEGEVETRITPRKFAVRRQGMN